MTIESSSPDTDRVGKDYVAPRDLDDDVCHAFWSQIERTLGEVLLPERRQRADLDRALGRLLRLRRSVDQAKDPTFPAAVYHLEPLQVAVDLSGGAPPTPQQYEAYLRLLRDFADPASGLGYRTHLLDEVGPEALARIFPDDPANAQSRPD